MSFVTTQPEMLAWTTENLQGIGWPTAALVGQRDPSGSGRCPDRRPRRREASRYGPTPRYGRRPTMTWLTSDYGSVQTSIGLTAITAPRRASRACTTLMPVNVFFENTIELLNAMMANRAMVNGDVIVASQNVAVDSRSRAPDVIASPVAKRVDGADRFRPDIEGMRAIAVGLVLLFHGYGKPFNGGFVGVDVFFVISGFLITSLLLHEQIKDGRISVQRFYARRVRRILPASALTVLVTIVAAYCLLGFISGNEVANAAKWTAVFAANIHFALIGTDYLGSQLPPSPLQHMWSLGVEEQFYLVWPSLFLLLAVIVRLSRRRNVLHVLAAFAAGSHRGFACVVGYSDIVERDLGILFAADSGLGACAGSYDRGDWARGFANA